MLTISARSSLTISVNITPATALLLYQPVTSVSRVDSESTDRILIKAFSCSLDDKPLPSNNMSKNGLRERSVLLLSSEIILWKDSSLSALRHSLDEGVSSRNGRDARLLGRPEFTTSLR